MRSSEEDERGLRCRPRNKKRDKKPSLADWPAGSATHSRHPSLNWLRSRPTAESKCCECEPPEEEESSCFEGWHRLQHHAVLMEVATVNFCREGWKLSQLSFIFDEPPCAVPCFPLFVHLYSCLSSLSETHPKSSREAPVASSRVERDGPHTSQMQISR